MKQFTKSCLIIWLVTCSSLLLAGNNDEFEMKFGKIDKKLLEMKSCALDTGAEAMVIGDIGRSYYIYNKSENDFDLIFERHIRIKIFKKTGYDYANLSVPLLHNNGDKEVIYGLKGYTFNLENGKEEKTKLKKDNIFEEELNDSWDKTKLSMPNVKEGSVVDISYKIRSDFWYNLREWDFQRGIPTAWSIYSVKIPEYYNFLNFTQGFYPLYKVENDFENGNILFGTDRVDYRVNVSKYVAKDMPAIKYEKFISTPNDFVAKIEFQLASIQWPMEPLKKILSDWPEVEKNLLESESFGRQINRSGFFKEELEMISGAAKNDEQKMALIYEFVRNKMKWNRETGFYSSSNIKKTFNEGTGNAADINLLLIAMMREAGFTANPVILSTRSHGRVHPVYPIISKFNYVIAKVYFGDTYVLLDATDPFLPFGLLPEHCINLQGREICEVNPKWVDIQGNAPARKIMLSASFDITENADLQGNVNITSNGYRALNQRKIIANDGEEEYIKEFGDNHQNWQIEEHKFTHLDNPNENLVSEYNVKISAKAEKAGNLIFISPVLDESAFTNNFKQEERKLPIDFTTPFYNTYMVSFKIPEGYEIDELPEKVAYALPGNAGVFSFSIFRNGEKISLNSTLNIKKAYFLPTEYASLKQFFDLIVAKQNEQIVLKKI